MRAADPWAGVSRELSVEWAAEQTSSAFFLLPIRSPVLIAALSAGNDLLPRNCWTTHQKLGTSEQVFLCRPYNRGE